MNKKAFCCCIAFILLASTAWLQTALAAENRKGSFFVQPLPLDCCTAALPGYSGKALYGTFQPLTGAEEAASQPRRGYRWEGPPAESPDWPGIKLDTVYFFGYQLAAIGILYLAPESFSSWSEEEKDDYSFSKWVDNVTNPVWDGDDWYINYILHPYWGATYYIRARERGFNPMQSFWYSFLLSSLYEFGLEAFFEEVSIQDMIFTPIPGALIGEYVFMPIREWVRGGEGQIGLSGKLLLLLTDPMGVANETLNGLFGLHSELRITRLHMGDIALPQGAQDNNGNTAHLAGPARPAWGLQLRMTW